MHRRFLGLIAAALCCALTVLLWPGGLRTPAPAHPRSAERGTEPTSHDVARIGFEAAETPMPQDGRKTAVGIDPVASVHGRVVSVDGEPIANATVCIVERSTTAKSDQRGEFVLPVPTGSPPGMLHLEYTADGFVKQLRVLFVPVEPADRDLGEFVLIRLARLRARVTAPIAHDPTAIEACTGGIRDVSLGHADASGQFDVSLDRFGALDVEFRLEPEIAAAVRSIQASPGQTVDLGVVELEPFERIEVTVTAAGGASMRSASVSTSVSTADGEWTSSMEMSTSSVPVEEFHISIPVRSDSRPDLVVSADGFRSKTIHAVAERRIAVELDRELGLHCTIVDAVTRQAIPEAWIETDDRRVFAKDDGGIHIAVDSIPPRGLLVGARGYRNSRIAIGGLALAVPEQLFALERGASLEGTVVDEHGEPALHADVIVSLQPPRGGSDPIHVLTGADGRFVAEGLDAGRQVVVAKSRTGSAREEVEIDTGATTRIDLVLRTLASVSGSTDGTAPHAVIVLAAAELEPRIETVRSGVFRFADVVPGHYVARAFADLRSAQVVIRLGFAALSATRGVDLDVGPRDVEGLVLPVETPPVGVLHGHARLGANPAVGCRVRVRRDGESGGDRLGATVEPDGSFRIDGVRRGPLRVELLTPTPWAPVVYGSVIDEMPLATKPADLDGPDLEIDLAATAGTLRLDGIPADAVVEVRDGSGASAIVHPSSGRRGVMVPAGSLRVEVTIAGHTAVHPIEIGDGTTTVLDLRDH
ncbi:MAG: carboxypeptidase-like regulatory domain-containing protein [Planctomycetota bacterium]